MLRVRIAGGHTRTPVRVCSPHFARGLTVGSLSNPSLKTQLEFPTDWEVRATYGGVFSAVWLYPLVTGEPNAFRTLALAWMLAGGWRLCSALFDGAMTCFNLSRIAFEFGVGASIALPHVL